MVNFWLLLANISSKCSDFFLNRIKSSEEEDIKENIILDFRIILQKSGDVFLETECFDFTSESIYSIAALLYFLNSGRLIELEIKSINTWIENEPETAIKVQELLLLWQTMMMQDGVNQQESDTEPLISPLTALEPDKK